MTSQENAKKTQRRNGERKTKKLRNQKRNMQQTKLIQEVQNLNEYLREMNIRLNALLVPTEVPTAEENRAAEIGKREIREGKVIPWEEVKKKLK